MDTRAKELCRIGSSLFAKKKPWDELCQEIAENFYLLRADFTSPFSLGQDFSDELMDSYPVQARELLGNAISAMLRQNDWFAVKTGYEEIDEDPATARWLEYATGRFRRLINDRRAKFNRATGEADHDYVTFGNAVLSVEESQNRDHFLFRDWHPRDCAWMENAAGVVDHLHRRMPMTARNMKRRWKDKVHSDIVAACEKEPDRVFQVRHIVLPAEEVYGDDRKAMRKVKAPFLSMYVDVDHETILGEGGLPVFNYVVPRWRILTGFAQGFSPATTTSLADGRMLQSLTRIILEQGEKAVDPPMYAKGELFRDAVNRYAGGLTYVDLEADHDIRNALYTEDPSQGLGFGLDMKQDARNLIAEAFLLNKLMLPDAREMTAFETQARLEEFRRAALPFFGPIETEYHLPLLDTAFTMALNNRQFDFAEAPDSLKEFLQNDDGSPGGELTFTFESPLNTAEGRKNVAAFQESVQLLAGAAQFDPSIPTTMDFKKMTKDAVKGTGAPADWFNDEEQQQTEEEAQAQVTRLAAAAEALKGGAAVATDVAGATMALKEAGLAA